MAEKMWHGPIKTMDASDFSKESYDKEVAAYRAGNLAGEPAFERPTDKQGEGAVKRALDYAAMMISTASHDPYPFHRNLSIKEWWLRHAEAELTLAQSATPRSERDVREICARICEGRLAGRNPADANYREAVSCAKLIREDFTFNRIATADSRASKEGE